MRKLWLLFSQAATVLLALWFVVATLKPTWIGGTLGSNALLGGAGGAGKTPKVVTVREASGDAAAGSLPSYSIAAKKAMPAVVSISTSRTVQKHPHANDPWFRFFFGDQGQANRQPQSGLGSGVIVSEDGYVLTNNHVVEGMDDIELQLSDGRRAAAKLVGTDPESDLAVLKVELKSLPAITFSAIDKASVGDVVLAIGNPFGVGQTVTLGIVSALGRDNVGINTFENFIQTDAAINPGNSGGALVDSNGNLLGINTAIYSRSGGSLGIGFAIPANTARNVLDQIISGGTVVRGWIGVDPQALTPELAEAFSLKSDTQGVVISGVLQNGPADKAGVKPGDVVVAVGTAKVSSVSSLLNAVAALKPQSKATVEVLRGGQVKTMDVQVGTRPKRAARE
jgi:serine protease DegQ